MANNNKMSTITGKGFVVLSSTTGEVAKCLNNLPSVQAVRGSVWDGSVSTALVDDIKAGNYVPPIVFAGEGEDAACVDGQQRSRAIAAAVGDKRLTGTEPVLVAVDRARTVEEAFRVLNIGVPVGASLVSAMDMGTAGKYVIELAAHPYFRGVDWTRTQEKRTSSADFASAALAIFAGWNAPESSAKMCSIWLKANVAAVTPDVMAAVSAYLYRLNEVVQPLYESAKVKGKAGKPARAILNKLKRKNLFMTVSGVVADGAEVGLAVKALSRDDLLCDVQYEVRAKTTGKTRLVTAKWSIGAGSSGSYSEYADRLRVLTAAIASLDTVAPKTVTEQKAAADVANTDTADLAAALGLEAVNG